MSIDAIIAGWEHHLLDRYLATQEPIECVCADDCDDCAECPECLEAASCDDDARDYEREAEDRAERRLERDTR